MMFSLAYRIHGPDTLAISKALGIEEHEADTLINAHMELLYREKRKKPAKTQEQLEKAHEQSRTSWRNRRASLRRLRTEFREATA